MTQHSHTPPRLHPEIAYDLVLDHAPLVMALSSEPRSLEELARLTGEPVEQTAERLAELLSAGFVEDTGRGYRDHDPLYPITRQEAPIDFLREQVLPSLTRAWTDRSHSTVIEAEGRLGSEGLAGLEAGPVTRLLQALEGLQQAHGAANQSVVTLLLVAVMTPAPTEIDSPFDRAIWRCRIASREKEEQRLRKTEPRSLGLQVKLILPEACWSRVVAALEQLATELRNPGGQTWIGMTLVGHQHSKKKLKEVACAAVC